MHKNHKHIVIIFIVVGLLAIAAVGILLNIGSVFKDTKALVLSLKGDKIINLNINEKYTELGATATDNRDGDLSAKIVTSSNVNTSRIGEYHVVYDVTDKSGNKAYQERIVNVLPPATNNTSGVPILMYHFFYDSSKGETPQDSNFTDVVVFDQQMKYLRDNNYYFPTWSELNDYFDGKLNLPQKSIIITDDDGSSTFFSLAYPVLVKYQIPATSFLITSWSGGPAQFNVDRNLISFQSHSDAMHTGGCDTGHGGLFQCIDYQSGYDDLQKSIQIVGSNDVFCYPFGDYNDFTKQLLRDTGFKFAVTTEWGTAQLGMDKLALPRVRIQGTYDLADFIAVIQ